MSSRMGFLARSVLAASVMVLGIGSVAKAEVYLETNVVPSYTRTNAGNGDIWSPQGGSYPGSPDSLASTGWGYDTRTTLGYRFWQDRIMLGGTVNYFSTHLTRPESPGADSLDFKTTKLEYGPTLSFFLGNLHFHFTYLVGGFSKNSQKSTLAGTTTTWFDDKIYVGNGYQILVGYSFNVSQHLKIGPTMAFRSLNYSHGYYTEYVFNSGNKTDQNFSSRPEDGNLTPMVTLIYMF